MYILTKWCSIEIVNYSHVIFCRLPPCSSIMVFSTNVYLPVVFPFYFCLPFLNARVWSCWLPLLTSSIPSPNNRLTLQIYTCLIYDTIKWESSGTTESPMVGPSWILSEVTDWWSVASRDLVILCRLPVMLCRLQSWNSVYVKVLYLVQNAILQNNWCVWDMWWENAAE